MSERDSRGYAFPYGDSYATRMSLGMEVELDMNRDGLFVGIEQGSGYLAQSCSTFIDMDVLVELLRRAGMEVRPVSAPTSPSSESPDPG